MTRGAFQLCWNRRRGLCLSGIFPNFGGRGGTRTLKPFGQRILSPPRIPVPPLALIHLDYFGGADEIRTRVQGFADLCLTPRPPRQYAQMRLL